MCQETTRETQNSYSHDTESNGGTEKKQMCSYKLCIELRWRKKRCRFKGEGRCLLRIRRKDPLEKESLERHLKVKNLANRRPGDWQEEEVERRVKETTPEKVLIQERMWHMCQLTGVSWFVVRQTEREKMKWRERRAKALKGMDFNE